MDLNLTNFLERDLEAAALHYEEHGFVLLSGLENNITPLFDEVLQQISGYSEGGWERMLDPAESVAFLHPDLRKRLARMETPVSLKQSLLRVLKPVLQRLIGPLIHVSSTFHSQFKAGAAAEIGYAGFRECGEYMELHGPYKLHQDFAGASFPITPSMLTLWVAMNTTSSNPLRLYPGCHRQGLLTHEFLSLDDHRLAPLGEPIDIFARRGTGVLFHGLMLHGTGSRGPERRISCDLRFFPLCGFLPSEVYFLSPHPFVTLHDGLKQATGPVQQAPLMEDLTFLGQTVPNLDASSSHSVLNWVGYIEERLHNRPEKALPYLLRMVNTGIGIDSPNVYVNKFHGYPIKSLTLRAVRNDIANLVADGRELDAFDTLLAMLEKGPL